MTTTKISQLPAAAALDGGELLPLVQSGRTCGATVGQLRAGLAPANAPAFTGQARIAAGSTALPGLAFTDDPDTGVAQSAGADSLSLVAAGAERLRVAGDGTIHLGAAPGADLLRIGPPGGTGSRIEIGTVGSSARLATNGSAADIPIQFNTKGNGGHFFASGGDNQFCILRTPGANRMIYATGSNGGNPVIGTNGGSIATAASLLPQGDNTLQCGESGARWASLWVANGTIQTSDARGKTDVEDAALGLDFVRSLRPVSFRWIDGGTDVEEMEDEPEVSWVQATRPATVTRDVEQVELIDGQYRKVNRPITETVEEPLFEEFPLFNADGMPAMEVVRPATGEEEAVLRPAVYRKPVLKRVETPRIRRVLTPRPGRRTHWGLIAQEVEEAAAAAGVDFGGFVRAPDGSLALRYDQFIAPLLKAVQELAAKVEALEARTA